MSENNVLTTVKLSDCNTHSIIITVPHMREVAFFSAIGGDSSKWVSRSSQQVIGFRLLIPQRRSEIISFVVLLDSLDHGKSRQKSREMLNYSINIL